MASIQLPPLSFEDGGFRVSLITGGSSANTANRLSTADTKPYSGVETRVEARSPFDSEPETESNSKSEARQSKLESGSASQTPKPRSEFYDTQPMILSPTIYDANSKDSSAASPSYKLEKQQQQPHQQQPRFHAELEDTQIQNELGAVTEAMSAMRTRMNSQSQTSTPFAIPIQLQEAPASELEAAVPEPHRSESPPPQTNIPSHPIESLQAAFAESLEEVTKGGADKLKLKQLDGPGRRDRLLEQGRDDEPVDIRWRYRPGQQQHEVLKLISQISFGVFLLFNGMANDNSQVVNILQGHIDEVDEFLEVVLEDLSLALADLNERIDCLRLPMTKMKVFEEMLEDRNYRAEIVEGNEKIDQVLSRMHVATKQWDDDVDAGLQGTTAFSDWLTSLKNGDWRDSRPDLGEIFDAMKGNADGWLSAFDELNRRTQNLGNLISSLTALVAEIEKKAGEVSRKTWSTIPPFTSPISGSLKSKRDNSSISSPPSAQSPRSATRASVRSGSITHSIAGSEINESLRDFPIPGSAPLLPPSRNSARVARKSQSADALRLHIEGSHGKPTTVPEALPEEELEDGPLYILQPRTYTPALPEPLPSPLVHDPPGSPESSSTMPLANQTHTQLKARSSIRNRVSLKGSLPEDIRIPPSHPNNHSRSGSRPSPAFASPRRSNNSHLDPRDSSGSSFQQFRNSSGSEADSMRHQNIPRAGSHADLRPARPSLVQSPNSDYQHYHPVRASPHSPLQQRPHTAAGPQANRPSAYFPSKQPSRLGSMAPLDSVAAANQNRQAHDSQTIRTGGAPSIAPSAGGKTLKKKKSAFGWFKKAFTMDDEERAAFEARKNTHQPEVYYKDKSPKFLDGRRLR